MASSFFSSAMLPKEKARLIDINNYPYSIDTAKKQAGVLLLFLQDNDDWKLILEKRTKDGSPHSAQISLVGGGVDNTDSSLLDAALREAEEEIGVKRENIEIIGALEPTVTLKSNYHVYPFVGILHSRDFKLSKNEIERLLFVPLDYLIKTHPFPQREYDYQGKTHKTFIIKYRDDVIWGATARIIDQFIKRLKGEIA